MSYVELPDPPSHGVGTPGIAGTWTAKPKTPGPKLGTVALVLVLAGPALMVLGFLVTIALGALFPLPLFLAAALTLLVLPFGLVTALVAVVRGNGRWMGAAAIAATVPTFAVALDLALPLLEYAAGQ